MQRLQRQVQLAARQWVALPASWSGRGSGPFWVPVDDRVWFEVSADGRQPEAEVLARPCEAVPCDPGGLDGLIGASDKTRLLAAIALSAASRTTWQRRAPLSRSLASGFARQRRSANRHREARARHARRHSRGPARRARSAPAGRIANRVPSGLSEALLITSITPLRKTARISM
jgi:hypothetical protein